MTDTTTEFVLAKCEYFLEVHLWPLETTLDPRGWLSNFDANDLPLAVRLLDSFIYISGQIADQLLIAAFLSLSRSITVGAASRYEAQARWRAFVDQAIFTYPTGEQPRPTDSGIMFARKARQILGIDETEDRILDPADALSRVMNQSARPVIFLDDFVGMGWQFAKTWKRQYDLPQVSGRLSFKTYSEKRRGNFYYIPLVATDWGMDALRSECPAVSLCPAHTLGKRFSVFGENSVVWTGNQARIGQELIERVSRRVGIPDDDGQSEEDWRGLQKQGLTLAFSHSVPDATLPIFYWERNGWKPLIRKS